MSFLDKIKNLFKKKDKAEAKDAAPKKAKGARAAQFSGEGQVAAALKYAAEKIDAKVAAGAFDDKRAEMFMSQLKGVEASGDADDLKLTQISQIIGGIINA